VFQIGIEQAQHARHFALAAETELARSGSPLSNRTPRGRPAARCASWADQRP